MSKLHLKKKKRKFSICVFDLKIDFLIEKSMFRKKKTQKHGKIPKTQIYRGFLGFMLRAVLLN